MTFAPALRFYGESQTHEEKRRICTVIDIAIVRERQVDRRATAPPGDLDH